MRKKIHKFWIHTSILLFFLFRYLTCLIFLRLLFFFSYVFKYLLLFYEQHSVSLY